jgi:hypothetical protein
MAINVTDVVSQFGAYYKPGSDNERNLRDTLYKASGVAALFQERPTEDTIWRGTLSSLDRVVQPFQKGFTAIGTITFKPNQFDLFKLKIDKSEYPDEIEATYLGFLASIPDADRANWPFVRFLIERHIMPRKNEDMVLEYYEGVYAAPTPGTAGAAGTSMNGLRKVIRDYNTAGRTNLGNGAIATGAAAADDADFCTQIEEFIESVPVQFRNRIDAVVMSETLARKYRRGKRKKYGVTVNYLTGNGNSDLSTVEDQPNVSVIGDICMEGSELFFTTIAENRIRPVKKAVLGDTMKIESLKREVFLYTDWWEALNFEVPEFIFHNDQDLS